MSRLEAVAAGLYYPTPEPVVSAIAQMLRIADPGSIPAPMIPGQAPAARLLDPCAGKGRALALLTETLQRQVAERMPASLRAPTVDPYAIEPNLERAQEAQARIPNLLVSSFFTTTLSEGGFQLALVNPPYDDLNALDSAESAASTGRRERLETRFLRRVTSKLAPDGVLIWIVPQRLLAENASYLAAQYHDFACWRFPDTPWRAPDAPPDRPATPMYAAFGQVVLLARRRRAPAPTDAPTMTRLQSWASLGADLAPLPDAGTPPTPDVALPIYPIPITTSPLRYFLAATFDPDALAGQLNRAGQGVWGERGYVERHWPDLARSDLGIGRPLAPLRRGHLALLAAAGIANGQELLGAQGQRLVVKGACRKVSVREESEERDPTSGERIQVTTETERFEVSLWAIDLDSGAVIHVA